MNRLLGLGDGRRRIRQRFPRRKIERKRNRRELPLMVDRRHALGAGNRRKGGDRQQRPT